MTGQVPYSERCFSMSLRSKRRPERLETTGSSGVAPEMAQNMLQDQQLELEDEDEDERRRRRRSDGLYTIRVLSFISSKIRSAILLFYLPICKTFTLPKE